MVANFKKKDRDAVKCTITIIIIIIIGFLYILNIIVLSHDTLEKSM